MCRAWCDVQDLVRCAGDLALRAFSSASLPQPGRELLHTAETPAHRTKACTPHRSLQMVREPAQSGRSQGAGIG
ncbi:hypothetical protein ACVLV4_000020 [Rathayibacter agropyri]